MRIGVMCSGNGTNFENIVRSCPEIDVVLMVYNKKDCGAVKRQIVWVYLPVILRVRMKI